MEPDARSSLPRERAVSSEPCSTRPNPFDDDDDGQLSARKRRRTSRTTSRSRSVETLGSQPRDSSDPAAAMTVDTPEPPIPSTPPSQSQALPEPHSSRVTINLRHAGRRDTTPPSPVSPSASRSRKESVKASVEESELVAASASRVESCTDEGREGKPADCISGVPVIAIDDDEDDEDDDDDDDEALDIIDPPSPVALVGGTNSMDIEALMFEFPYHATDESYYDTIVRLVQFLSQRKVSESRPGRRTRSLTSIASTQIDEVLVALRDWFDKFLLCARSCPKPIVVESYMENKSFWQNVPDLFYTTRSRVNPLLKCKEGRDFASHFFAQLARLAGYFASLDCAILQSAVLDAKADQLELTSPCFVACLGYFARSEDTSVYSYSVDGPSDVDKLFELFRSGPNGAMTQLVNMTELLLTLLERCPRKTMDAITQFFVLADSIMLETSQKFPYTSASSQQAIRYKKNLSLGYRLFKMVSGAVDVVMDKFLGQFSADCVNRLIPNMNSTLSTSLLNGSREAVDLVEKHRADHPDIPPAYTAETIANEWRFGILGKLIRSRQMQLRVAAVSSMSTELVNMWKRYNDTGDDNGPGQQYLRYFSGFLAGIGLVDYLFGPTCHPEITQESSNIIGFLVVTRTFTTVQADLFWQTVTSTQDPRVADALVRMIAKITHLMVPEQLGYMWEHLERLPLDALTPFMRDLCETMIKTQINKLGMHPGPLSTSMTPIKFVLRLVQESSVFDAQGSPASAEIQNFAVPKFKELVQYAATMEMRQEIILNCLRDIAEKKPTTTGSITALWVVIRASAGRELVTLIEEHNLTHLLVEDLEATIAYARQLGPFPVLSNPVSAARREIIFTIIGQHGSVINPEDGRRLWDCLVGDGAACHEDRRSAWEFLNAAQRRPLHAENPFLVACLHQYLPALPPSCYCEGTLEFVRDALLPLVDDPNSTIFDEEGRLETDAIELLWQMILAAPPKSIEKDAIHMLVNDIYVDSKLLLSFPLHRARKVHSGLLNRCLEQMAAAAQRLRKFTEGTPDGDDDPMVIVPTEDQQKGEELKFTRSLAVLRTFLRTLQTKSHFAAPDLRSLMLQSPGAVEGDSAQLKYQSFDGDEQSEVKTLNIGIHNTAASLLASLREATGFDNYRIFYRGAPLAPTEDQICASLEDLDIHDGLILVKKETDVVSSPVRIKPGASPLEIEILSHFKDLWEYLSMDEKLAREIYTFVVKLPADESILQAFENTSTSYRDIFPLGQPFKCLYAIHALREYLSTRRLKTQVLQVSSQDTDTQQKTALEQHDALLKAMSLLVGAICDPEIAIQCPSEAVQASLSLQLVESFLQLLKESVNMPSIDEYLSPALQNRLLAILSSATTTLSPQYNVELVNRVLEALLECCARSRTFWDDFRHKDDVISIVQDLLLGDERPFVRKAVYKLISSKCIYSHGAPGVPSIDFAEYFWPIVFGLFPRAMNEPAKCEEVFNLAIVLMKKLAEVESPVLNLRACLAHCGALLLAHTTAEDISRPEVVDVTSHGLVSMIHYGVNAMSPKEALPFPDGFGEDLFRKHLFPLEDSDCAIVPQVLLHPNSRSMLCDILLVIAKSTPERFRSLLQDMCELVPYETEREPEPYPYELLQFYDRHKAVRSPCGYSGLRNLSNTCYLNSLFTQLFMNTGFRRFILETPVADPETHQLLSETQMLFAQLQYSARRFVDPGPCVASIMTYDETPIDIHNQMDVDEFYNLLFDRWETQLPDEKAKRALKSIYGGQLVQQVKSKECEHISERIEPFSAIQCDIKGKANLEESLQAYVDGEIMEGDNKYKCEMCDRHVDAVKRACLKELPDNLIFHLKRFDFNLRTLQRSKINDFFPFPDKIDMQPYTVEGLSDPSGRTDPDTFELVGVLVHSGNAESGHYYSFIRERPSLASAPSWMEFNDDSVLAWDPAHMENACFGGPDYRQTFENTIYDKVYSAYMLFYQRSSSVKREQALLELSGKPSPLKFSLPPVLEAPVKADNWAVVHRYCLNDAVYGLLVRKVLSAACGSACSKDHETEDIAMDATLGYLDQIASRAKDTPDYEGVLHIVVTVCKKCPRCCLAMFRYLTEHGEALRNLLQRNAEQSIRQSTSSMLIWAFGCLRQAFPVEYGIMEVRNSLADKCVTAAVRAFVMLWDTFHVSLRAWPEYFGTMAEFAQLGRVESGGLLHAEFLMKLLLIVGADGTMDLPSQYARMVHTINRRVARGPPSYEYIIALIDTLLGYMDDTVSDESSIVEMASGRWELAIHGQPIPYTAEEINLLHKTLPGTAVNAFVDKLIQINQNAVATDSIIVRLMELHPIMANGISATLRSGISGQVVAYSVAPYIRVAAAFVRNSSTVAGVQRLINHICQQCRHMQNTEAACFLEFFKEIHDGSRVTEDSSDVVRMQSLRDFHKWVPGLLACADEAVSCGTEKFVRDVLFPEAPTRSPTAAEVTKQQALANAGRDLAAACLEYLQETYIRRRAQAPRHAVGCLEPMIKSCGVFFPSEAGNDEESRAEYEEHYSSVLEQVRQLVVDEIEDEGSGMWSDSSSATLDDMH